ncbi:MAG: hypothetical protein ABI321_17785 [Polyangia bacterium]
MKPRALFLATVLSVAHAAHAAPLGPQDSLVELLPARATVAIIVRKHAITPLRDLVFSDPDMMRELGPYLDRTLGLDLTRIDGAVVFALSITNDDPHYAIVAHVPQSTMGALNLPVAGDAGGTPLYHIGKDQFGARIKAGIVVGYEAEVRVAVAVDRGREPALTRDSALGRQLSVDVQDVDMVIASAPGAVPADKTMGMRDATLQLRHSGLLELVLHGEPATLNMVKSMATIGLQSALSGLQQDKDKQVATGDPAKGAVAIYTYYAGKKALAELDPKVEGDALKIHYKLPDVQSLGSPALLAAAAGIAAAVGLPALNRFQQKSKRAGAMADVRRIATAVETWSSHGGKLVKLKSTDWTPAGDCCSASGKVCAASTAAFDTPTWKAVAISIDGATAFHYRLVVDAKLKRITVEAQGDPDCDGARTTLRSIVSFAGGTTTIGEITTDGDLE